MNDLARILIAIFISATFLFCGSFIFSAVNLGMFINRPKFKAVTNFGVNDPISMYDQLALACTNDTLGNETRTYSEDTFIFQVCPESQIPCTKSFCDADGYCRLRKAANASCLRDSECPGIFSQCTDSCVCEQKQVCNATFGCETNSWNQCLVSVCVDGEYCDVIKNPLLQCASAEDCANPFQNDCIDCMCVPKNMTDVTCATPINQCTIFENNAGNCTQVLAPGAMSWSDPMCVELNGQGWALNASTCQCYQSPFLINCPIPINECTTYENIDGNCTEILTTGSESWSDQMCVKLKGEGWALNASTCQCYKLPFISTCSTPINECTVEFLDDDECIQVLAPGATSWSDSFCVELNGEGWALNASTCQCYKLPFISTCSTPINDCVIYNLVDGECIEDLAPGAASWSDQTCVKLNGEGWALNASTCQCYELPFISTCSTPINDCVVYNLIDGECIEDLAPGAESWSDQTCVKLNGEGWAVNASTCQCYKLPFISTCSTPINDCVIYNLVDGECIEGLAPGAESWSDQTCVKLNGEGWALNASTCQCYELPFISKCSVPINNCTTFDLVDGECIQVLAPGASSWSDEMCADDNGQDWFLDLSACECYQQTIVRTPSFNDGAFEIFDNVDPTKILKLNVDAIPAAVTATLGLNYNAASTRFVTETDTVSGTTSFTTRPWTSQQSPSYVLQRIGNLVFLWMQGVTAFCNSSQQAISAAFIPLNMRPTSTNFMSVPGASGGVTTTISVVASPSGTVSFSVINGGTFAAGSIGEYAAFTMFWRTNS